MFNATFIQDLDALCARHGIARSQSPDGSMKLVDGSVERLARQTLDVQGRHLGLSGQDYGTIFVSQGRRFKLTGIKSSRPKYPLVAECLNTGKVYKFPTHVVPLITAQRSAQPSPASAPSQAAAPSSSTHDSRYAGIGGF